MLLEIAIGDAYGAGFEFVSDETIKEEHNLTKYYASRIDDLKVGQYTDDTQMTLAISELMISQKVWTKELVTKHFLEAFNRDRRCGYAKGFYKFLTEVSDEYEFLEKINPESVRNGAAMRSVPLSLIKDITELKNKAKLQASVTHNTYEGIISSQAVALIGNFFLYQNGKKENIKNYLYEELFEMFKDNKTDRVPCDAIETIDAVVTVLVVSNSFSEIIDKSVRLGGDTDSVASIACGLATLTDQYTKDLPEFLYTDLENETYGREYIINLDKELLKLKE